MQARIKRCIIFNIIIIVKKHKLSPINLPRESNRGPPEFPELNIIRVI